MAGGFLEFGVAQNIQNHCSANTTVKNLHDLGGPRLPRGQETHME